MTLGRAGWHVSGLFLHDRSALLPIVSLLFFPKSCKVLHRVGIGRPLAELVALSLLGDKFTWDGLICIMLGLPTGSSPGHRNSSDNFTGYRTPVRDIRPSTLAPGQDHQGFRDQTLGIIPSPNKGLRFLLALLIRNNPRSTKLSFDLRLLRVLVAADPLRLPILSCLRFRVLPFPLLGIFLSLHGTGSHFIRSV